MNMEPEQEENLTVAEVYFNQEIDKMAVELRTKESQYKAMRKELIALRKKIKAKKYARDIFMDRHVPKKTYIKQKERVPKPVK